MNKRYLAFCLALILLTAVLAGCAGQETPVSQQAQEQVILKIAGGWPDCRAIDVIGAAFTALYPNCTVSYEYLQDYYNSLEKRMTGESPIDLFFASNIQSDSTLLPYVVDLKSREDLDLSNTFQGLIDNFSFREDGKQSTKLYCVPLGAEIRGLYVNKTLLKSAGLDVPTDQKSLLAACEVLKQRGLIPFHGNPGNFSQILIYPWICNIIANADDPQAMRDLINARGEGLSELFREPYAFLYTLVENGYYDYKTAQTELDLYNGMTDEDYARDFLNIGKNGDVYEKIDDMGRVAFMPSPLSLKSVIDKTKDDYHSEIDYSFILAPISQDGSFAYLSPAHGMAANSASPNVNWAIKFLDFLFMPKNSEIFAQVFNVIPNTKEAFSYIHKNYDVADDHISQLGDVTFNFGFYDALLTSMTNISKANNPKYMNAADDGSLSLYPLDYYMEQLEASLRGE